MLMANRSQSTPTQTGYITIDIDSVVRSRMPGKSRFIPRWFTRRLEKIICQDQLNEMLRVNAGRTGADFCRGVLDHLDISYSTENESYLGSDPRVLIVCNHPLGGLDGMILIDIVTHHFNRPVKFLVNDLLTAIRPLNDVFLPINKHGRQSQQTLKAVDEAFESDSPIIIFPAGLVSRKGKNGVISDLRWQKTFVNKAIRHQRDIIPCFFSGQNSKFFYNFAKLRTSLGLKFNIEMIRLPHEVFDNKGKSFIVKFAAPISCASLRGGSQAQRQADIIRDTVYNLDNAT